MHIKVSPQYRQHPAVATNLLIAVLMIVAAIVIQPGSSRAQSTENHLESAERVAQALLAINALPEAVRLLRFIAKKTSQAYGPNHPRSIAASGEVLVALAQQGSIAEARRSIAKLEASSATASSPQAQIIISNQRSRIEGFAGNHVDRLAAETQTLMLVERHAPANAQLLVSARAHVAESLIRLGRHKEAQHRLDAIVTHLKSDFSTGTDRHYSLMGWVGLNELALGRPSNALSVLQSAMDSFIFLHHPTSGWWKEVEVIKHLPQALTLAYWADKRSPPEHINDAFRSAGWLELSGASEDLFELTDRLVGKSGEITGPNIVRELQDEYDSREVNLSRISRLLMTASGASLADAITEGFRADEWLRKPYARFGAFDQEERAKVILRIAPSIKEVQGALRNNEALVRLLHLPSIGAVQSGYLAWVVTKTNARWIKLDSDFNNEVGLLRCGLDFQGEWVASGRNDERFVPVRPACKARFPNGLGKHDPLPFDVSVSAKLYDSILRPFEDLIRDRSLVVVANGPLATLPLGVLVDTSVASRGPDRIGDNGADMWLGLRQPVSTWPSVAAFTSLRKLKPSTSARYKLLGVGNPLLLGASGLDKTAWSHQHCPTSPNKSRSTTGTGRSRASVRTAPRQASLLRDGIADVEQLRLAEPLPGTTQEVCAVAAIVEGENFEATVLLGEAANEGAIKAFSATDRLAQFGVIHIATHGLLSHEASRLSAGMFEPALVLSPPSKGTVENDGLLTSKEIRTLRLDADWVVLSACNTAAGGALDGAPLSGLASSFFFAGARTLLVSHWYVKDAAAAAIITNLFRELQSSPLLSKSEALTNTLRKLVVEGSLDKHPAVWAPFVIAGEGGKLK